MTFQDGDELLVFFDEDDKKNFLSHFEGVVLADNYEDNPCSIVVRGQPLDIDMRGDSEVTWATFEWFEGSFSE